MGGSWVDTGTVTTFFSQSPQDWFVPGTLRDGQVSQEHGSTPQENSVNSFLLSTSHRPRVPFSFFTVTPPPGICPNLSVLEGKEEPMVGKMSICLALRTV